VDILTSSCGYILVSNNLMKPRNLAYVIISVLFVGCGIINPELRYTPKSSDEFYFPQLSEEVKLKQAECMRLENFPCVFKQNDTLSDFVNEWYSTHLKSLKEPILYKQIRQDKKVVRFTHLGTWSRPYSYRIEKIDGKIIGTFNKTKGLGGYNAGRRIKNEEKEIKIEDWNLMIAKIDSNFWNIPTHDPNMILDGEEWILEVLINDKYHVVSRNSPDNYGGEKYAELCKTVINTYNNE
jgi:hypothetical protein